MTNTIITELQTDVLVIRFNRPAQLNAWTMPMREVLCEILDEAVRSNDVRALVFTGTGNEGFCAGQDLAETEKFAGRAHAKDWIDRLKFVYDKIRAIPKPVVGAINGVAAGSGFQLTLLMDINVGHRGVTMGQTEVNSGIPSVLGPAMMVESLGRARTTELAVTGRLMGADECHRYGLIHHLVDPTQVLEKAVEIARDLASKPAVAMKLTKEYLRRNNEADYEQAWKWAEEGQLEAFASGEPQQAMREFFEARRTRKAAGR
ncbi:MAG TPA: enoyl-CoA hydratase/isomerase family protein [Bradyrhizobium sp.]|nr:enoyl-CoA hydratase/isomerase family protein [Bradyrhizobium sp.]